MFLLKVDLESAESNVTHITIEIQAKDANFESQKASLKCFKAYMTVRAVIDVDGRFMDCVPAAPPDPAKSPDRHHQNSKHN